MMKTLLLVLSFVLASSLRISQNVESSQKLGLDHLFPEPETSNAVVNETSVEAPPTETSNGMVDGMKSELKKTAHIFVINLKDRTDRCQCMQEQLKDSPYEVFRQDAVTKHNYKDHCPGVVGNLEARMTHEEQAIFCSNQMIYDRINRRNKTADFYINVEDDLKLKHPKKFWEELRHFLESDCSTESWDMIAVDTFGEGSSKGDNSIGLRKGKQCFNNEHERSFTVYEGQGRRWGAHFTIVKASAIPKLMHRHIHIADHFDSFRREGVTVRFWQPEFLMQMDSKTSNRYKDTVTVPSECGKSVKKADNKWFKNENWQAGADQSFFDYDC